MRKRSIVTLLAVILVLSGVTITDDPPVFDPSPAPRKARPVQDVIADLKALTPLQMTGVWNDIQMRLVAAYCRDNPKYLVAPAFNQTVNVAGDQLA